MIARSIALLSVSVFSWALAIAQKKLLVKRKPVIIGYVAGYKGLIDTSKIDVQRLTHINYAFADVSDNRVWLHNEQWDTTNLQMLVGLKQRNPDLKILVSVGGWSWSKNFSDAVLTDSLQKGFAASAVQLAETYHLDGIDIDWEYPNQRGDGNRYRPEDKQNYTLLFAELRRQLNVLQRRTGRHYLLTTAAGGFSGFLENTEMGKAQQYLDYINLMSYDYGWDKATHHTNLYASTKGENAADNAVALFLKAGVPAHKLVMGLAFYGKGKTVIDSSNNGLHQPSLSSIYVGGYTRLKDSLVNQQGYKRYWDEQAKAPFLFNSTTRIFITYDDEESVRHKCRYVKQKGMGGVMFWEYSEDMKGYLLREVSRQLLMGKPAR